VQNLDKEKMKEYKEYNREELKIKGRQVRLMDYA
jgi:hypothetical protein